MNIDVYQTIVEEDGTITAYVHFMDGITGKKIKSCCFQGASQAEFERQISDRMIEIEAEQVQNSDSRSMVSAAITKIKEKK